MIGALVAAKWSLEGVTLFGVRGRFIGRLCIFAKPFGVGFSTAAASLLSIQLREFGTQSFSILLVTLLGLQELAQKFAGPGSVVATVLKLGNETPPLPLDYDLAVGHVLLR